MADRAPGFRPRPSQAAAGAFDWPLPEEGRLALLVGTLFLCIQAGQGLGDNAASALFFLRFWRRTDDALFLYFAFAFVLLAVNQALPTLLGVVNEDHAGIFLFRLAAFLLIIFAIWRKNRTRS